MLPPLSADAVKRAARAAGFHVCGLAPAGPVSAAQMWRRAYWLEQGMQAGMHYLERYADLRSDVRRLLPEAATVISCAVNYSPAAGVTPHNAGSAWHLARYACGDDYHDVLRAMLRTLAAQLGLHEGEEAKICVDTAPIDEKYWAARAGLGWIGRHTQLIIPCAGSFFFLGEIVTTRPADRYDAPMPSRCGTCRACLNACPAAALVPLPPPPEPHPADGATPPLPHTMLDARRCLSYLTIEHRGALPHGTGERMGHCLYGCDRCAEVCPWNKRFATPTRIAALQPRPACEHRTPADWLALTEDAYRRLFSKSAVKRAKYEGLMRNIHALHEAGADPSSTP